MASALGNHSVSRIARRLGDVPPGAHAALTGQPWLLARRMIARQVLDAGVEAAPAGVPDSSLPDGGMAPPDTALRQMPAQAQAPVNQPAQTPAAAPPPDRDAIIRTAIDTVLERYRNLAILVPLRQPPDPGARPGPEEPPLSGPPQQVTFQSPYFINRSGGGDGGRSGARSGLGRRGARRWFNGLPSTARVGKGSPDELQAAMQQAVDQGLLNDTWPPTSESLHQFMRDMGLGVDCSGFVYLALEAADDALVAAGLPGLTTPTATTIGNTSSQALGRGGGTRITDPRDLRAGDIIQMAPHGTHTVGHVRILTDIRIGPTHVEYDTAESTTRVGHGPTGSTWRIPVGGPMDVAHLEVRDDATGAWSREATGRPTSYWRRLGVEAAPAATPGTAPAARSVARTPARGGGRRATLARDAPRSGGWNEADREVTGTWRIPLDGLTQGMAANDPQAGATTEETPHRAVAVVPRSVTADRLEVLVHLHGNNLGERERTNTSSSGMKPGTVRDVEGDLIPQQLAASGRNIIGILPQGRVRSGNLAQKFGITDINAYVTDVLGRVVAHVNQQDPTKNLQTLTPVRVIVSGHSGGGPASVDAAEDLQATSQSDDQHWVAAPPLMLFDAINGPGELTRVRGIMVRWLNEDKRRLLAKPLAEAQALMTRRGVRLRSTYTGGVYHACNSKRDPRTYHYPPAAPVTIPASDSLEAARDAWFAGNRSALGALAQPLLEQYVIEHVSGSHDFTVGAGTLQTGPRTAVPGVTQSPARGADATTNQAPTNDSGNLGRGLGMLSSAAQVAPPPPAAATTVDAGAADAAVQRSLARSVAARDPGGGRVIARQDNPAAPAPARQPPGSSGTHGGERYVVYQDEVRIGGTKAWRNNNPGNIVGGDFANGQGAIGTAFNMAVFPDLATGLAALYALLRGPRYRGLSIRAAITRYAPPHENDTEEYIRVVTRGAGVPETTLLQDLTDAQLDLVVGVIRRHEGWSAGTTATRSTGPDWARGLLGAAPPPAAPPAGQNAAPQTDLNGILDAGTPVPDYSDPDATAVV